jgi:hypothetical protein
MFKNVVYNKKKKLLTFFMTLRYRSMPLYYIDEKSKQKLLRKVDYLRRLEHKRNKMTRTSSLAKNAQLIYLWMFWSFCNNLLTHSSFNLVLCLDFCNAMLMQIKKFSTSYQTSTYKFDVFFYGESIKFPLCICTLLLTQNKIVNVLCAC